LPGRTGPTRSAISQHKPSGDASQTVTPKAKLPVARSETQSSAILGAQIAGGFSSPEIVIFTSLSLYLLSGVLYLVIIILILYRWIFEPMAPEQLTPSYWIRSAGKGSLLGLPRVS
jgi:Voltage-dependent anion channel